MTIREWINSNPVIAAVASSAVLALIVGAVIWRMGDTGAPVRGDRYYMDMDTGRIFRDAWQVPPVTSPGGAAGRGVVAHVFSCGSCPDVDLSGMTLAEVEAAGAFVHYLERTAGWALRIIEASEELEELSEDEQEELRRAREEGRVVARPDRLDQWHAEFSEQGESVMVYSLEQRCTGPERPQPCLP